MSLFIWWYRLECRNPSPHSRRKQFLELLLMVCSLCSISACVNRSDGSKGSRVIRLTSNMLTPYHDTISFAT